MLLTHPERSQKTLGLFDRIHTITEEVFKGIENPPDHVLNNGFVNGEVFVVSEAGEVKGYAIVKMVNHEPFLWSIAVSPSFQGRGAGSLMLDTVETWARAKKYHRIDLTVKIDNTEAQRLYLKKGYKIVNIIQGFYGNEGDGIVMRRTL